MLHDLADEFEGRVEIETLDINEPDQLPALHVRLSGRVFDMLLVNPGTTTKDEHVHIGHVTTEEFVRVMITNALSPMRVIEVLEHLVPAMKRCALEGCHLNHAQERSFTDGCSPSGSLRSGLHLTKHPQGQTRIERPSKVNVRVWNRQGRGTFRPQSLRHVP
jgi:NAD(P)-dependent dehydrogenase (short-subunit alcohol dehydrogenase family)